MEHQWQYGMVGEPPSEANIQARTLLLDMLQRGVPGYPTDDRFLQSQKNTGLIYTAIRPLRKAIRKADVTCMKRVRRKKGRTTFGPGVVVAKSVSASYGKAERTDYVPVDADNPVARLLDRPQQRDGTETLGDVLEYATLQACLTGVSPFWCVPSAKYLERNEWRPVQLYALPTALTIPQAVRTFEYPVGYYRLMPYYATPTGGGGWYQGLAGSAAGSILDGREVKRRLYKHPLYRWDGYSPLTACAFLLDIAEAIDQARWAAMQHGSTPDIIFTASGMESADITKFGDQWTARNGGARNHRRMVAVSTPTPEAKLDIKTPFVGAREMDYTGSWEQATKAVLAVFGVPPAILFGAASYAEFYAAVRYYHDMTVVPECEELGDFLTTALAQPWEEEEGELCIQVIPPEPRNEDKHVIPAADRAKMGLTTYNESRASQNLPPVPGGDVPLDVYLKQLDAKLNPPESVPPELAGGKPGGPTAGAPPRPENPDGKGTRPPTGKRVEKAMSTLDDPAGGFLVPPASVKGAVVVTDPRKIRRLLRRKRKVRL